MDPPQLPFEVARLPRQRRLLGYRISSFGLTWVLGCVVGGLFLAGDGAA